MLIQGKRKDSTKIRDSPDNRSPVTLASGKGEGPRETAGRSSRPKQEGEKEKQEKSEGCMSALRTQNRAFEGANMHKSTFHYEDNPRRRGEKTDEKEDED